MIAVGGEAPLKAGSGGVKVGEGNHLGIVARAAIERGDEALASFLASGETAHRCRVIREHNWPVGDHGAGFCVRCGPGGTVRPGWSDPGREPMALMASSNPIGWPISSSSIMWARTENS